MNEKKIEQSLNEFEDKTIVADQHIFAGIYDRVNISVKTLDKIIFGGIVLVILLVLISLKL